MTDYIMDSNNKELFIYFNALFLVLSCPQYNNIPKDCHMVKKAGDCCETLECPTGYFYTSSTKPDTIGNGGSITVINPPTGAPRATIVYPMSCGILVYIQLALYRYLFAN